MKDFVTINELVGEIKQKINELHMIVDTLLMDYRNASDLINGKDHRQKPLEEMQSLYRELSKIAEEHPAMNIHSMYKKATNTMTAIATYEQ